MRLAISNIAWDVSEDAAVADLLRRHDVHAVDVAPGKYFPDCASASAADVERVRRWWQERGIEITGMQGLLFGTTGLNLFGPHDVQEAMLRHLGHACRIASGLGARRLVFGSPRNRDRGSLSDEQAAAAASGFFRRLGDAAAAHDVVICLEPNPARYGCNFMTSSAEAAEMVKRTAHPAVLMQLDTGAITANREDPAAVLARSAPLIGHIHASEPGLVPLGEGGADHAAIASLLRGAVPDRVVAIEMLVPAGERRLGSIERALRVAIGHYRR
jgi:D-psicose/D-tagatose/L-ribulose 3-epimerase